jgi:hypothetical protein
VAFTSRPTNAIGIDQGRIERHDHRTEAVFDSIGQKANWKEPGRRVRFIRAISTDSLQDPTQHMVATGFGTRSAMSSIPTGDIAHIPLPANPFAVTRQIISLYETDDDWVTFACHGHRIRASSHSGCHRPAI